MAIGSSSLVSQMLALLPDAGQYPTGADGITLIRSDQPTARTAILYEPVFYIVIQGRKVSYLGSEVYPYDRMNFLALSVPLPMEGHVIEATPEQPYLALKIALNTALVRELLLELPDYQHQPASRGVCICTMSEELVEVIGRLLNTLTDTNKTAVLAPLAVKEALFHVLQGPQGAQLCAFATQGRHNQRVAQVIRHIRHHYSAPIELATLAEMANMSPSSLHQHFKAVTNTSPLQYLKAVRLHQAHQLVTLDQRSISEAAYQVGYQSLSQFSREYKRLFGQPPSQAQASALRP